MATYYSPYYADPLDVLYETNYYGGEGDSGNTHPVADLSKSHQIIQYGGNTVEVTPGQRKVGGPPPDYNGEVPGQECEVFIGKIPRDIFEDELIPLFEQFGEIWDFRLMMNPISSKSRGYAFVKYKETTSAKAAVHEMEQFEIRPGKELTISLCKPKVRLFVGNIPKVKGREELLEEFGRHTEGLVDCIVYNSPDERKKNRGFCFLEYISHKHAYLAKKKLFTTPQKFWGCDIIVDWADPMEEPEPEIMSKVKVLYVRNLTQIVTQERLRQVFLPYGNVERVKKIKDYAFVHFEEREEAGKALEALNGKLVCGTNLEVTWAKPPTDKKKRETILRARERRTMQLLTQSPRSETPRGSPIPPPNIGIYYGNGGVNPNMSSVGRGDFNHNEYDYQQWEYYQDEYSPYYPPTYFPGQSPMSYPSREFRPTRQSTTPPSVRGPHRLFEPNLFEGPPNSFRGPRGSADEDNWRANLQPSRLRPSTRNSDNGPVTAHGQGERNQMNYTPTSSSAPFLGVDW